MFYLLNRVTSLLSLTLFLAAAQIAGAAEIDVGSTKDEVLKEWGQPKSSFQVGKEEVLTYATGTRVELENGKVVNIKNREAMKAKPPAAAPTSVATSTTPAPAPAPLKLPKPVYSGVPKATIVTDPNFRVQGTWGGESDGKTIGVDGKPLADHKIYSLDTYHFKERIDLGMSELLKPADREHIYPLSSWLRAKDDAARQREQESFQRRYKVAPAADPLLPLVQLNEELTAARNAYDQAEGQLNYLEKLRMADRIDLEKAPNPEGAKWREQMKEAIARMQLVREEMIRRYPHLHDAGRKQQEAANHRIAAAERFATTRVDGVQLLAYASFDNTPMLQALAAASIGQTNLNAKPIFIPKGERVKVLETLEKGAPPQGDRGALQLHLTKIQIQSDRMIQHDGKKIGLMTLQGWVLSRDLEATR